MDTQCKNINCNRNKNVEGECKNVELCMYMQLLSTSNCYKMFYESTKCKMFYGDHRAKTYDRYTKDKRKGIKA